MKNRLKPEQGAKLATKYFIHGNQQDRKGFENKQRPGLIWQEQIFGYKTTRNTDIAQ